MSLARFLFKRLPLFIIASQSHLLYAAAEPIEPVMVDIPGGQLLVHPAPPENSSATSSSSAAAASRTLVIAPFRIGKYEVTAKEFGQFIAATNYPAPTSCQQMYSKKWFAKRPSTWKGHKHTSSEFEPVSCIGWNAMQAYVDWLSKETGKPYRLPSDAEWEYAARAGTTTTYFWGEDPAQACTFANTADQAAEAAIKRDYDGLESKDHVGVLPCDDKTGYASVVGIYQPNAFGLHDMIGNINEFTADCETPNYPGTATTGAARVDGDCSKRVIRGGSWHWSPFTSASRGTWKVDFVGALEGFRIAEDIQTKQTNTKSFSEKRKQSARNKQFRQALAAAQKAAF
ncbi:MAG TPA: formylglycine-generating enzyme family protein [Cellvibrio sp.]|nr:formylglycine-generating enzyme family protein [Cellvibrio sp.]